MPVTLTVSLCHAFCFTPKTVSLLQRHNRYVAWKNPLKKNHAENHETLNTARIEVEKFYYENCH